MYGIAPLTGKDSGLGESSDNRPPAGRDGKTAASDADAAPKLIDICCIVLAMKLALLVRFWWTPACISALVESCQVQSDSFFPGAEEGATGWLSKQIPAIRAFRDSWAWVAVAVS